MTHVPIPGGRDVRGTFEAPADTSPSDSDREPATDTDFATDAIVVACPPHPRHGGGRSDGRLVAVSDALVERGIDCLRFDYGPWDEGRGECEDVRNAIRWAVERTDRVGVFGYSFGASEAILASATVDHDVGAVAALAPTARLDPELDVVAAIDALPESTPLQVLYGSRDTMVDWEPVVERARERGSDVVELPADHFFAGQRSAIAEDVGDYFEQTLVDR